MSKAFSCGAAKVKITPSEELLPFLFGLMGQQYGRVHDDLFLRVTALGSGDTKALIVVYDLDKAPYPAEWIPWLSDETGIPQENIFYLAIHTHTAPLTGYRPFEGPNFIERKPPEVQQNVRKYEAFLKEKLLQAAREAIAAMVPARMGFETDRCDLGVNRCRQYLARTETGAALPELNIGTNDQGIADSTLLVVRFEDAQTGKPIALLTNYAVHCVAVFRNSCADGKAFLSADIGGAVSRALEQMYPGCVAQWTSAPAGDINPRIMVQNFAPDPKTGKPEEICIPGESAADSILRIASQQQLDGVLRALDKLHCNACPDSIRGKVAWARTLRAPNGFQPEAAEPWEEYEIRLHLLQIGDLALIGADGELYTSLGQAIREASPVKNTYVCNHECSLLLNNPGYVMDDATLGLLVRFDGRGAQRGGIPGGGVYTRPGTVKQALEEATEKLFQEEEA